MAFALSIWTVYDHPRDFPDHWIARRWDITEGKERATSEVIASKDLEEIRNEMLRMGLTCLPRHGSDDPTILESWI